MCSVRTLSSKGILTEAQKGALKDMVIEGRNVDVRGPTQLARAVPPPAVVRAGAMFVCRAQAALTNIAAGGNAQGIIEDGA